MMDGWDGGMSTAGWLAMTLLWIVLIAAIVWALANLLPSRRDASSQPERPEEILDRRLAQGDIDAATYDELRAKLRAARSERV